MATTNVRRTDRQGLLPEIQELTARVQRYPTPRVFYVGSERRELREAVEIDVRTSRPIRAQAITPSLYVGEVEVAEYEPIGPNAYRYYGVEPQRLRAGAPIFFAYPWQSVPKRTRTRFTYRLGPPLVT